jgi:hypothetical protein
MGGEKGCQEPLGLAGGIERLATVQLQGLAQRDLKGLEQFRSGFVPGS